MERKTKQTSEFFEIDEHKDVHYSKKENGLYEVIIEGKIKDRPATFTINNVTLPVSDDSGVVEFPKLFPLEFYSPSDYIWKFNIFDEEEAKK